MVGVVFSFSHIYKSWLIYFSGIIASQLSETLFVILSKFFKSRVRSVLNFYEFKKFSRPSSPL